MTKVIAGARRSGKTTELIRMSAEEGLHIVVSNYRQIQSIQRQAREIGIDNLPIPCLPHEVNGMKIVGNPYVVTKGRVLVDNADNILSGLLGMSVAAMTVTTDEPTCMNGKEYDEVRTTTMTTVTNYPTGNKDWQCFGCDACHYGWHISKYDEPFHYCPNCGAKVVEE